jgi:hypothetical protein
MRLKMFTRCESFYSSSRYRLKGIGALELTNRSVAFARLLFAAMPLRLTSVRR